MVRRLALQILIVLGAFNLTGLWVQAADLEGVAGDSIKTREDQTAKVHLKNGVSMAVGPSSELTIRQVQETSLGPATSVQLERGIVHVGVPPSTPALQHRFFLRTKTATMGVRGTDFIAETRASGVSTLHTFSGTVAIAKISADLSKPGVFQTVHEGEMSSTSAEGRVLPPKKFDRQAYFKELNQRMPQFSVEVKKRTELRRQNTPQKEKPTTKEETLPQKMPKRRSHR